MTAIPDFKTLPGMRVRDLRHRYRRGDQINITDGKSLGIAGAVDSRVFQESADHPGESASGYHISLASGQVVTVRWDKVEPVNRRGDRQPFINR